MPCAVEPNDLRGSPLPDSIEALIAPVLVGDLVRAEQSRPLKTTSARAPIACSMLNPGSAERRHLGSSPRAVSSLAVTVAQPV